MKAKPISSPDEMRMKATDFDRIMRGVLEVAPPPPEPKTARKKTTKTKKTDKK
jgi:hypothetical protein